MSNLEHLIENAISSVKSNQSMEEWIKWEEEYGNLKYGREYIKTTPEEIWEIAMYVVYTHDMTQDVTDNEEIIDTLLDAEESHPYTGGLDLYSDGYRSAIDDIEVMLGFESEIRKRKSKIEQRI